MVVCPDCGKDVKDAKFCSNCGALLPKGENIEINNAEEVAEEIPVESSIVESEEVIPEKIQEGEIIEVKTVSDEPDEEVIDEKTKFCTNCGSKIRMDAAFCPQCGFKFNQDDSQTKFCQSCGKKIDINAEICPYCGVRVASISVRAEKSVLLAALLSFIFPGLGHLYNGLTKKAISFIIVYLISAILVYILIGFILIFIVWIWALIDAIKTANAINAGDFVEDKLF